MYINSLIHILHYCWRNMFRYRTSRLFLYRYAGAEHMATSKRSPVRSPVGDRRTESIICDRVSDRSTQPPFFSDSYLNNVDDSTGSNRDLRVIFWGELLLNLG